MYSPKIAEDLIAELYVISSDLDMPMTKTVDEIIRNYVKVYKKHEKITPQAIKSILEIVLDKNNDEY